MVPDVFQIIVKEKGVFTNVTSPSTKAKLRILFEVAPLAFLVFFFRNRTSKNVVLLQVEYAGGKSSCDGQCVSALDIEIKDYDQRSTVCFGSEGEVKRFEEFLYGILFQDVLILNSAFRKITQILKSTSHLRFTRVEVNRVINITTAEHIFKTRRERMFLLLGIQRILMSKSTFVR